MLYNRIFTASLPKKKSQWHCIEVVSQSPTLRPRRERWKQVMLANRALVKLHRLIPRAVDVTDYRIIDQFQLNHRLGE